MGCHALLQKIFPTQETPRDRSNLHLLHFLHWQVGSLPLLDSSIGEESACNAGDLSSIPGSGRAAGEGIDYPLQYSWASLVAWLVKNPPSMQETWVQSLGWEDSLEKGYPLQYFSLENSMELCIVHRVTELDTTERLSLSLPLAPPGKLLLDLLLGHQGPITTILLSMTTLDTRYK